ncbi:helix-turn-helix domain-containing protein [Actinoplanes siamensis]|uniref:helix-turn-helix domain-containing protein n=1 Tax=Actinoplanes siamensis TaxID=1223317 RepID=UPI0023B2EEE0
MLTGVDDADATPGGTLRRLRDAAGYSLAGLAKRAGMDRTLISMLERGKRPIRPHHAEALDKALGANGALQALVEGEGGAAMQRREAIAWMLSAVTSVTATTNRATLDEVLRFGLIGAMEQPEDWDSTISEMQRRLVLVPDEEFGATVGAKLLVVRKALADRSRSDDVRAAAMLSLLYGLWQGNQGRYGSAMGWYHTASALARKSGDPEIETYVLGRSASRGVYEGMSRKRVTELAEEALAVTGRPTLGGFEARGALAGVHAMTGNVDGGREQVRAMRALVGDLPDDGPTGPAARAANFDVFVEARAGDAQGAERARAETETALARTPLWLAESRIYYALSVARAGFVSGGAALALEAIRTVPWNVHTLAMAAADVLTAIPREDQSDEVMELRRYAAPATRPWETL